ncbi:MAG: NAD(P)H-binding protein, partial [Pseudomonadota bacterium]
VGISATAYSVTSTLEEDMNTVLVLGGYGFIGRHIVRQLRAQSVNVLIGTRAKGRSLNVGERRVVMHKMLCVSQWLELLTGVDAVVNSVGILRARQGESFEQVHHQSVSALSQACEKKYVRLVHISALGLDNPLKSAFAQSKRDGEQAIMRGTADWHIVRASLVEGEQGYGARWFRRMAGWPIHFAPNDARGLICPVHVDQLAKTVVKVALSTKPTLLKKNRVIEVGGEHLFCLFAYLQHLRGKPPVLRIRVPARLSRWFAYILDFFHATPYSYGHYEILKYDNYPAALTGHVTSRRIPLKEGVLTIARPADVRL